MLGGAAAAWPVAARAQQPERVRRIGVLIGVADDAEGQARLAAFQKGMQELGWNEGREMQMAVRFTAGTAERARTYAAELVAMAPDAILANTGPRCVRIRQQTQSIPIVFAQVVDPVSGRLCGKPCAPRRKRHRIPQPGFRDGREMARKSSKKLHRA